MIERVQELTAPLNAAVLEALSGPKLTALALLLLSALGCAGVAYVRTVKDRSLRDFFSFVLPTEIMSQPSARADFQFWITKKLLMPFVRVPAGLFFVAASAYATNRCLGALFNIHAPLLGGPAGPLAICLFTFTMLLAYDLSYYLYHRAQHRFPLLWELHKVHHSAEVLVGVTKDRVHPIDEIMNKIWDGVIHGFCFGVWSLVALDPVEVTIFGVNVYVMRNILMMDFVRHTHLKISFGPLNNIVLCPHWHQLHHSIDPAHIDKNFGLMFSFWDHFFGTLCTPKPDETFKFGLADRGVRDYQSLFGLYVLPLKNIWHLIKAPGGRNAASATDQEQRPLP